MPSDLPTHPPSAQRKPGAARPAGLLDGAFSGGVRALVGFVLALTVIGVDQATKHWILTVVRLPERRHIDVSAIFDLTMVWNYGVSFGLFRADSAFGRWFLVAFAGIIACGLAVWLARSARWLTAVALGLVLGGAIGNLIDRVRFGAVVDFFDFSALYFPWVFNVADAAISVGVALLFLDVLTTKDEDLAAK